MKALILLDKTIMPISGSLLVSSLLLTFIFKKPIIAFSLMVALIYFAIISIMILEKNGLLKKKVGNTTL
jgi:uncharacterized membrane protein